MHIDYPVVLTTIIGFVIVVLVLRKLAWGPILELLDQRRDKIKSDFANASQARTDAESMRGDLEVKLGQEAQVKADSSLDKARHDIEVETQKAQIQLRDQVVDLAIKSSEILLKQKLDDATHRKLIQDYIDGLEETPNA
jgi:F-type H+-transporting ATPase subunit b